MDTVSSPRPELISTATTRRLEQLPAARVYQRPPRALRRFAWVVSALLSAVILAVLVLGFGVEIQTATAVIALSLSVIIGVPIAVIDHRYLLIPNWLVGALGAGLLVSVLPNPVPALLGAACVAVLYMALHLTMGMGMGDVKLATVCALAWGALGVGPLVVGVLAGFAASFPAALRAILKGRRGTHMAFGPWILAGSLITLVWSLLT